MEVGVENSGLCCVWRRTEGSDDGGGSGELWVVLCVEKDRGIRRWRWEWRTLGCAVCGEGSRDQTMEVGVENSMFCCVWRRIEESDEGGGSGELNVLLCVEKDRGIRGVSGGGNGELWVVAKQ